MKASILNFFIFLAIRILEDASVVMLFALHFSRKFQVVLEVFVQK